MQSSWHALLDHDLAAAHDHVVAVEWEVANAPFETAAEIYAELDLIHGAAHALRDESNASLAIGSRRLGEPGLRGAIATSLCRLAYWRARDFGGLRGLPIVKFPGRAPGRFVLPTIIDLTIEAVAAFEELKLPLARRLAWEALQVTEQALGRDSAMGALAAAVAAYLALEEGRLDEAERLASSRLPALRSKGDTESAIYIYDVLARVAAAEGRHDVSARVLDDGCGLGERKRSFRLVAACTLCRLELLSAQSRMEEALQSLQKLNQIACDLTSGDHLVQADLRRYARMGRAIYEQAAKPSARLAAVFSHLRSEAVARRDLRRAVQHSLSLATVQAETGERDSALATLAEVVALGGSIGLFQSITAAGPVIRTLLGDLLDQQTDAETYLYIQSLLAPRRTPCWTPRPAGNESLLSDREGAILRLIGDGLPNKRIAQVLDISPETVKSHIKNIFVKFAVGTRLEAVRRARTLGLI